MKASLWRHSAVLLVGLSLVVGSQTVVAATTYQYVGNNFTVVFDGDPPAGSYTKSMSVSGSFTVADPLTPMPLTDITQSILSFSFFDGRNTLTQDTATNFYQFEIGVNAAGEIDQWWIAMGSDFPDVIGGQFAQIWTVWDTTSENPKMADKGLIGECVEPTCTRYNGDQGGIVQSPGNWSVVPIPAAGWLFGSSLGLLGWLTRRAA